MRYLKSEVKSLFPGGWFKVSPIAILLFCFPLLLTGQQKLVILSADTVFSVHTLEGDSPAAFRVLRSLLEEKQSLGYYQAGIDSLIPGRDSTTAYYHQGPLYSLEASITGTILSPNDTLLYSFDHYGSMISQVDTILSHYRNSGHPFVRAHSRVKSTDSSRVFVQINIQPGDLVLMDTILVRESPPPVSSSFLRASLDLKKGGVPFSEKKLEDIEGRISRMDFLEQTFPPELILMPDYAGVKLGLRQGSSNMLDGLLGFSSGEDGSLLLNGNVDMRLINYFSHGEQLNVRWAAPGNESQSLNIHASAPYLAGTPFGADFRFSLYKQDTSYLTLSLRTGVPYRFSYNHFVEFFYRYQTSNVMANIPLLPGHPYDFSARGAGVSYYYSTLTGGGIYRAGWLFQAEFSGLAKSIEKDESRPGQSYEEPPLNSRIADISLEIQRYQKVGNQSILLLQSNSKYLKDENAGKNQLFRLGGFQTLKGFDQDEFYAQGYSTLFVEYRFYPDKNTFFSAFWNGAVLKNQDRQTRLLGGLGGGVAVQTKAGILNLYYALGKDGRGAFKFKNSKIHMGFISTF